MTVPALTTVFGIFYNSLQKNKNLAITIMYLFMNLELFSPSLETSGYIIFLIVYFMVTKHFLDKSL